jgi:hypothetical protein
MISSIPGVCELSDMKTEGMCAVDVGQVVSASVKLASAVSLC